MNKMDKINNPFKDINYEIIIKPGINQPSYLTIYPTINIDGTYTMILSYHALTEINKGLQNLFKCRAAARERKNSEESKISWRIGEFELDPIFNLDGTYTINVNAHEMQEIMKGMKQLENRRMMSKKYGQKISAEKKKQILEEKTNNQNNIYENSIIKQNQIKLKVVNPV